MADWQIREMCAKRELVIDNMKEDAVQPVSVDVHLGNIIKTENPWFGTFPGEDAREWSEWEIGEEGLSIPAGKFFLASTAERFEFPNNIVGVVRDKSTLARRGVFMSHGLIDPGFRGFITLEFVNHSSRGVVLEAGMPIGQVTFERVAAPVARPYGHEQLNNHYQDQEATPQTARA